MNTHERKRYEIQHIVGLSVLKRLNKQLAEKGEKMVLPLIPRAIDIVSTLVKRKSAQELKKDLDVNLESCLDIVPPLTSTKEESKELWTKALKELKWYSENIHVIAMFIQHLGHVASDLVWENYEEDIDKAVELLHNHSTNVFEEYKNFGEDTTFVSTMGELFAKYGVKGD